MDWAIVIFGALALIGLGCVVYGVVMALNAAEEE